MPYCRYPHTGIIGGSKRDAFLCRLEKEASWQSGSGSGDRPLSAFNGGFAAELVRLGYRPNAAANQLPVWGLFAVLLLMAH